MKKMTLCLTLAALAWVLPNCSHTTTVYEGGERPSTRVESGKTVSADACTNAALSMIEHFAQSRKYGEFLRAFRTEVNDPNARPLTQLGRFRNKTMDTTFDPDMITDKVYQALFEQDLLRITRATGRDAETEVKEVRDLENDANFNQETVVKRGTLNAPRLSLNGTVIQNVVKDNDMTRTTFKFKLEVIDLLTGEIIWTNNEDLIIDRESGLFGK